MNTDFLQKFWAVSPKDLADALESSLSSGLSADEAARRLAEFGANRIGKNAKISPLGLFFNQFKSPIVIILLVGTVISAFLGDWADAIIILAIVLGSALLSFFQEYNASNVSEKLRDQISVKSQVVRDGATLTVPSDEIVPGDIALLKAGSLIPADGLVLEAKDFFVNQSALTGETFPVEKKSGVQAENTSLAERTNVVFMGTNVRSGDARVLITQTGSGTAFGHIAARMTLRPPETEFERGIRRLGYLLSEVMFILVLIIFVLNIFFHKPILDSLLFSIALAVGLTPQLLPAIININLSKGSQAMAQRGVIIRRLEAIENFGSMDVLCTDKTGTLTMGVVQLDGAVDPAGQPSQEVMLLAYLNAHLQTGLPNALDEAITSQNSVQTDGYEKVDEIPYDFIRKRLSVVVKKETQHTLIVKGAYESVLSACDRLQMDGQNLHLDSEYLGKLHALYEGWSQQGYRVLGVAQKTVQPQQEPFEAKDEAGLVFSGFLLFFDPPKPGVEKTIEELRQMGVSLKIITGDNALVARHVAEALKLSEVNILTGKDLNTLPDEALWNLAEKTTIFAEVDPNQKERIILALKKRGHVVGYMGDGINDAPSLHSADVGISVDNAVDVAKDAAELVMLRQDLEVLREGIIQGRKTFANTLKYVFMATSANFGNMFSMAGASLLVSFFPMLPKQILLINFLTDLPEMTIASDNVDPVYVQRPHRWDLNFIRRFMLVFGPLSSLFDFATFGVLLWVLKANEQAFHTGWLIESVLSASLVVFTVRSQLPLGKSHPSKPMLLITALVGLFVLVLPYTPLAGLLGLVPLPIGTILILLGIVAAYVFSAELTKRWFYRSLGRRLD